MSPLGDWSTGGVPVPVIRACYLTRAEAVLAGVEQAWDHHSDDDIIVPLDHIIALSTKRPGGA